MDFIRKNKKLLLFLLLVVVAPIFLAYHYGKYGKLSSITPKKPLTYQCPSVKQFCTNGGDITKDNIYLGFGANLEPKSPIFASFDGTITASTTILSPKLGGEKLNTLYIDNKNEKIRAIYYFKGQTEASSGAKVKKGDLIGKSLDKISAYDTSVIFQIIKGDLTKNELVKLTTKDFVLP